MGQTVNLLVYTFGGSNPSSPTQQCCGSSSVDRASAFQAEGRGFEPRLPLKEKPRSNFEAFCFIHILKESSLSQLLIKGILRLSIFLVWASRKRFSSKKRGETCEARGAQRYVITAWLRVLARNLRTETTLLSQKPCEARESEAICTPRLTGKFYYVFFEL